MVEYKELDQLFEGYFRDMRENGLAGIANYYNEPAMILNQNRVAVLESNSQVEEYFSPMVAAFKAQGFDHMKPVESYTQDLSEDTALVSSLVVRYKEDGSELNRASARYVLYKNSQGWKIASFVIGDLDSVIRC